MFNAILLSAAVVVIAWSQPKQQNCSNVAVQYVGLLMLLFACCFSMTMCQTSEKMNQIVHGISWPWFVGNNVLLKNGAAFCSGCGCVLCNRPNHVEPFVQPWCGV